MAKFEIDTELRTIKILDKSIILNDFNEILKKYISEPGGWELIMSSDTPPYGVLLQPSSSNIYKYVEDDTNN